MSFPAACDRVSRALGQWPSALSVWLSALVLAGCSVFLISAYDPASVERIDAVSKSVLKFYQDLRAIPPAQRKPAMASTLARQQGDIESLMRLHLLREQARPKNEDSIKIASGMLESWQAFSENHLKDDASALSNATLDVERGIMERHLRSAFTAEEAKKLGGN
jgi:hypothetical protein